MGEKVLRVGWIVCSEENASGSERGGRFSGDLGARILGIAAVHRPQKHLMAMAGNHGACDEKTKSHYMRAEKSSALQGLNRSER